MARIRSVSPDLCVSETMAELPATLERTFVRLWTHCDDDGRCVDNPRLIKAAIYPLHDAITAPVLEGELAALADAGLILRYEVNGKRYLLVRSWGQYQHPKNPAKSKCPPPADTPEPTPTPALPQDGVSHPPLEFGVGEGEGEGGGVGGAQHDPAEDPATNVVQMPPPSASANRRGSRLPDPWPLTDELRSIAAALRPEVDPDLEHAKFCDFWHAKSGRDATKLDWVLTWRNWIRNARAAPRARGEEPLLPKSAGSVVAAMAEIQADERRRAAADARGLPRGST